MSHISYSNQNRCMSSIYIFEVIVTRQHTLFQENNVFFTLKTSTAAVEPQYLKLEVAE